MAEEPAYDIACLSCNPLVRTRNNRNSPSGEIDMEYFLYMLKDQNLFDSNKKLNFIHQVFTLPNLARICEAGVKLLHIITHGSRDYGEMVMENENQIGKAKTHKFKDVKAAIRWHLPQCAVVVGKWAKPVCQFLESLGIPHIVGIAYDYNFPNLDVVVNHFHKRFYERILSGATWAEAYRIAYKEAKKACKYDPAEKVLMHGYGNHDEVIFPDLPSGRWVDKSPHKGNYRLHPTPNNFMGRNMSIFQLVSKRADVTWILSPEGWGKTGLVRSAAMYLKDRGSENDSIFAINVASWIDDRRYTGEAYSSLATLVLSWLKHSASPDPNDVLDNIHLMVQENSNIADRLERTQLSDDEGANMNHLVHLLNDISAHGGGVLLILDQVLESKRGIPVDDFIQFCATLIQKTSGSVKIWTCGLYEQCRATPEISDEHFHWRPTTLNDHEDYDEDLWKKSRKTFDLDAVKSFFVAQQVSFRVEQLKTLHIECIYKILIRSNGFVFRRDYPNEEIGKYVNRLRAHPIAQILKYYNTPIAIKRAAAEMQRNGLRSMTLNSLMSLCNSLMPYTCAQLYNNRTTDLPRRSVIRNAFYEYKNDPDADSCEWRPLQLDPDHISEGNGRRLVRAFLPIFEFEIFSIIISFLVDKCKSDYDRQPCSQKLISQVRINPTFSFERDCTDVTLWSSKQLVNWMILRWPSMKNVKEVFVANCIDGETLQVLESTDLQELGISQKQSKQILHEFQVLKMKDQGKAQDFVPPDEPEDHYMDTSLLPIQKGPKRKPVDLKQYSPEGIVQWMIGVNSKFDQYKDIFLENGIDGEALEALEPDDLNELGMKSCDSDLIIKEFQDANIRFSNWDIEDSSSESSLMNTNIQQEKEALVAPAMRQVVSIRSDPEVVFEWLLSLSSSFAIYKEIIIGNGIDGHVVSELDMECWQELGVNETHAKRIIKAVQSAKPKPWDI